ncbi:defensin-2-like [Cataglyphis hispanica]|uniref:defensin-2-like n=1 Tax=Cataglyphis hispanica TaxID=1086592 RepID=UPI0021809687|nr:defensin-2-like [Cataglyphis hispanica]
MKFLAIFIIFAVLVYVSTDTLPAVYDGPTYELTTIDDPAYDEMTSNLSPIRHRRITCDLLSWQSKWLTINHSACAAKCLAQRRRGGRCRDGICICRN